MEIVVGLSLTYRRSRSKDAVTVLGNGLRQPPLLPPPLLTDAAPMGVSPPLPGLLTSPMQLVFRLLHPPSGPMSAPHVVKASPVAASP